MSNYSSTTIEYDKLCIYVLSSFIFFEKVQKYTKNN